MKRMVPLVLNPEKEGKVIQEYLFLYFHSYLPSITKRFHFKPSEELENCYENLCKKEVEGEGRKGQ